MLVKISHKRGIWNFDSRVVIRLMGMFWQGGEENSECELLVESISFELGGLKRQRGVSKTSQLWQLPEEAYVDRSAGQERTRRLWTAGPGIGPPSQLFLLFMYISTMSCHVNNFDSTELVILN